MEKPARGHRDRGSRLRRACATVPEAWHDRLRRTRGACRVDGARGRAAARVADARGVPRSGRRHEPHSRPELDRAGNPHRPPPRGHCPGSSSPAPPSSCPPSSSSPRSRWVYQRFGSLPEAGALLRGIKPVMVVIVVQALVSLGHSAIKNVPLAVAGVVAVIATVMRVVDEITLLAIAAIGAAHRVARAAVAWLRGRGMRRRSNRVLSSSACRALAAVSRVCEGGIAAVRKRLRAAGVPAGGSRRATGLAHARTVARCDRRRTDHARPRLHDRHVHRLSTRRMAGRRRGDRGHLRAGVRIRGG